MKIIILHDADARIEYLDVADHLIGSDIEEFLTRQGFSVNNITWLVTSADHIPVVYHKYDIDRKTGEATHTQRNAPQSLRPPPCRTCEEPLSARPAPGAAMPGVVRGW